jgi:HEAT repeat protein
MVESIRALLLAGIIGSVPCGAAAFQVSELAASEAPQDRGARVLTGTALDENLLSNTSLQVPALIAVLEDADQAESLAAIRALAAMKSKASPAMVAISKKLSVPDHATRSAAVVALVSIGDGAVVHLRKLLTVSTGRTRASATHALVRLKRLEVGDVARLCKDPDPRVRAATVEALSGLGKTGVPLLADMLRDPELAVAVEAARALKSQRDDPSIAIPALTQALSREHLSSDAGDAVSAYGIAARRAVPEFIKARQEEALKHVGPPAISDIPQLLAGLAHGDEETRILAAKFLALLGPSGKSAAGALEAAADRSIKDYAERKRRPKPQKPFEVDSPGRLLVAAEECAVAVWAVTLDIPRLLGLLERLAIAADEPIDCSGAMGLPVLSADDCRRIRVTLRHPNPKVRDTGLNVLSVAGSRAEPLKLDLLRVARDSNAQIAQKAIRTLAAIGPVVGREAEPVLLSLRRDGAIPLLPFAEAVGRLRIRSEATRVILERGQLYGLSLWTKAACASALCMTTDDPRGTARMIIAAAQNGTFTDRFAISILNDLNGEVDFVIPYLISQLQNEDCWTRAEAIDAIGSHGARASTAAASLKKLLDDADFLIRLKAASAVFLIDNDPANLEREFERVLANGTPYERHNAIATIMALKRSGGRFVRFLLPEFHRPAPHDAETAIKALGAIGSEEAVAALQAATESSDWMIRSQAAMALRQIRNPGNNGRP